MAEERNGSQPAWWAPTQDDLERMIGLKPWPEPPPKRPRGRPRKELDQLTPEYRRRVERERAAPPP
jgi:hypothetical protein